MILQLATGNVSICDAPRCSADAVTEHLAGTLFGRPGRYATCEQHRPTYPTDAPTPDIRPRRWDRWMENDERRFGHLVAQVPLPVTVVPSGVWARAARGGGRG